jgi:hypothetical protein
LTPWFSASALAIAARRANVAGVVRLVCTPEGLEIELIRVTGISLGFAPGAVAEPVSVRVPYTAVRGLVREGRLLYLALDPALVKPYSRFALARFSEDPGDVLMRASEARARARWASFLLPLPLGALAAALVSADLAGGTLGRAAVGAVVAIAAWALLRELTAWQTWGGPLSDRLRDRFEAELAERLALAPALPEPPPAVVRRPVRTASTSSAWTSPAATSLFATAPVPARAPEIAPPPPARTRFRPPRLALPRVVGKPLLAAIGAALGVLVVVAFLGRYAVERTPPPAVERAQRGLAAAARSVHPDVRAAPEPPHCLCARADSPLWENGIPWLSVLTFEGDEAATADPEPKLDKRDFPKYQFDLAIVDNAARALRDVRLTLTFARRTAGGKRVGAVDRGLFWEGVLAPGHAVKWHVSAPGNELRTDVSVTGTLESARLDPAPADAFFALTSARVRAVRVHGAVMLAYLRDPRAADVARALAAQSSADDVRLARVRRAAAPVIACDVRRNEETLEACIFNGASQPKSGLALREVPAAPNAEPRSFPIERAVPVHDGLRLRFQVPPDLASEVAVADPAALD